MFVSVKIEETRTDAMTVLVNDTAVCAVTLIADVAFIVAERDSSNKATLEMPPVLKHQLVALPGREFADTVSLSSLLVLLLAISRRRCH